MSIFDAPILPQQPDDKFSSSNDADIPEERLVYSIWLGQFGKKMFEMKVSDSWNVISRYWEIQKKKLRKSNPIKEGYIVGELRFWRTDGFVYERKTNRKGYLLKLLYGPGHGLDLFVNKYKQAIHYALKFKRMHNVVEIYKCHSANLNTWIKIETLTPNYKPGPLIVLPNYELSLIPGVNYESNY